MPRDRKEIEAGLKKKGFRQEESHHHYFLYFNLDGSQTVVFTKTSHGMKEISDDLLGKMARQCHLKKKQFLELVDCPLTQETYNAHLVAAGVIKPPAEEGGSI